MKTYTVHGVTKVAVTIEVEAESAQAAIDLAYEQFDGLTGFCGNGGTDKLVGTTHPNVSLEPHESVNFIEAEAHD